MTTQNIAKPTVQSTDKQIHAIDKNWLSRHERAIFILPPTILVLCLTLFPLIGSLLLSLYGFTFGGGLRFVGWENWLRLLRDDHFLAVAQNTILYVVVGVPIQYTLGFGLALLLNQDLKGQRFFRVLFLLPMMLSPVSVAFITGRMMFNEAQGPINHFLRTIGAPLVPWLTDSTTAFITVLLVDSWQWTPFMMLLILAGLQGVPRDVVEAARLEGTSWQIFWHITFPMVIPWSITAILLRSIEMLKIIDPIVIMTNGGPGIATESLTLYAYQEGIVNLNLGYASVIAYTLLISTIIIATIFLIVVRRAFSRVNA